MTADGCPTAVWRRVALLWLTTAVVAVLGLRIWPAGIDGAVTSGLATDPGVLAMRAVHAAATVIGLIASACAAIEAAAATASGHGRRIAKELASVVPSAWRHVMRNGLGLGTGMGSIVLAAAPVLVPGSAELTPQPAEPTSAGTATMTPTHLEPPPDERPTVGPTDAGPTTDEPKICGPTNGGPAGPRTDETCGETAGEPTNGGTIAEPTTGTGGRPAADAVTGAEPAPTPADAPQPGSGGGGGPAQPTTWTVAPGESFWTIAEDLTSDRLGRRAEDREVDPVWRRLVDANRGRLLEPGNPDLLWPGQVLDVPPTG